MSRYGRTVFFPMSCCLLCLILAGCAKNLGDQPGVIIRIEEDFSIALLEELLPGENNIQFVISTVQEQSCQNFQIDYNLQKRNRQITMTLNGMQEKPDCPDGPGFPVSYANLGFLKNQSYEVRIALADQVQNNGWLQVTDSVYELNFTSTDGFIVAQRKLHKIPDTIFWGSIRVKAGYEALMKEWENILIQKNTPLVLPDGNYGYFEVYNHALLLPENSENQSYKNFLFGLNIPEMELKSLIENFRTQHADQVTITLFTGSGAIL